MMISSEGNLPTLYQFGLLRLNRSQVLLEVTQDLFTFILFLHFTLVCHVLVDVAHHGLDTESHFHGGDHLVCCFNGHTQ